MDAGLCTIRRRAFRFTVRQLLVAVALVAFLLAVLTHPIVRYRHELRVLQALRAFGGYAGRGVDGVTYARIGNAPGYVYQSGDQYWAVPWFSWADGLTSPLTQLHLDGSRVTDKELALIENVPDLVGLWLDGTNVTDAGLVYVEPLQKLNRLYLSNTKVTDAGLEHLRGLHDLAELRLGGTGVTAEGVERLQKSLPGCRIAW